MKGYHWLIIGAIIALVVDFVLDVPHQFDKPFDYQTAHYGILAVVGALIFGGLMEWRLEALGNKIDRLATNRGCPRGHLWPVDGCPFCQRDSRYL
jgi:hypothetical protein